MKPRHSAFLVAKVLIVILAAAMTATGCAGGSSSTPTGSAGTSGGGGSSAAAGLSGHGGSGVGGATTSGGNSGSNGGIGGTTGGSNGGAGPGGTTGAAGGTTGAPGGTSGGSAGGLPASAIIVQDNFDTSTANGPADSTKWMAYASSDTGAPVIDGSKFSSPPNSARTQGTSSGDGSFLVPVSGLPAPQNRFYVRVRINFGTGTSALTGHAAYIVGATTRSESGTELRLGASIPPGFGTAMMDLNLQNPIDSVREVTRFSNGFTTGGNPINAAGFDFMANHWYCLEALFDGGNDAFHVWIDGTENTNMAVTNFAATGQPARTAWAPTFNFIKIGAQNYSGDIGTVWYDDVVVATQQVGCDYNP
jgi:hypothetical protein